MPVGHATLLRAGVLILGALMLLGSISADSLSLSAAGGISEGRVLQAVFGALLLGAGAAGRRLPVLWLAFGRLLLLASCIFLLGLSVTGFARAVSRPEARPYLLPRGMIPGVDAPIAYAPNVMWTLPGSLRITLDSSEVWLYGAAPVSPDSLTEALGFPSGTVFADRRQPGYNSTQSLILLMLDLRDNNPPDTVVLIAGEADARAALDTGDPRWPLGSGGFIAAVGSRDLSMNLEGRELAERVAGVQMVNRSVLNALAGEYGFRAVFLWIPACGSDSSVCRTLDSLMAIPQEERLDTRFLPARTNHPGDVN